MAQIAEIVEDFRLKLSRPQMEVIASRKRITANISGQGGGKTLTLAILSATMILKFPELKGFIGANTYLQLNQSTLTRVLTVFKDIYGMTEYNKFTNPRGHFVINKKPPSHWTTHHQFPDYRGVMSFWNGCAVFLGSLDNYMAHDGKEFAWAHLDETKDTEEKAVKTVILGRLRQKGLWVDADGHMFYSDKVTTDMATRNDWESWNPLYIHTSPADGTVDWLIDLLGIAPHEKEIRKAITHCDSETGEWDYFYKYVEGKRAATVIYSTYHNAHNLPPNYISDQTATKSAGEILKFIFGYPFGMAGGQFFPGFDRLKHLHRLHHDPLLPLHLTWDFNATPYITLLLSHVEYVRRWWDDVARIKYNEYRPGTKPMQVLRFRFFKEYTLPSPQDSTEATCEQFLADYAKYKQDLLMYGDATGRNRIVGLGTLTQYRIIENVIGKTMFLADGWLRTKKTNIENLKRRDLMNRIWEGKIPQVEIEIDEENCPNLVKDCEYLKKGKDGKKHKEKAKDDNGIEYEKYGHPSDAMEYEVCELCQEFIKES